jgi:hypothetical protein
MKALLPLVLLLGLESGMASAQDATPSPRNNGFYQRFFDQDGSVKAQAKSPSAAQPAWTLFPKGGLPTGKSVSEAEVVKLPVGSHGTEPTYLVGNYIVAASTSQHAVLRAADSTAPMRILVEYPASKPAPAEGAKLAFIPANALLIQRITRSADGIATVYTRDITQP